MAGISTISTDLYVAGALASQTLQIPPGSVNDSAVASPSPPSAAIAATKLGQQRRVKHAQSSSVTSATDQVVVAVVGGTTGTLVSFKAGMVIANAGAATVVVDLLKNGTTILSATITLNSSQTAYQIVNASGFTSTSLVAGDVLEVKFTATAGGGTIGKGAFALLTYTEDPS